MKTQTNPPSPAVGAVATQSDATKLVSLLALATGAAALPQTGHADIIFTDLGSSPVVVGYAGSGTNEFIFDLPGTARIGFERQAGGPFVTTTFDVQTYYNLKVVAGDRGGGAVGGIRRDADFFAVPQMLGDAWSQAGVGSDLNVDVGSANDLGINNGRWPAANYNNRFLAWYFTDDSAGNVQLYGWVEISLNIVGYNAGGPSVTIHGYAYDNTGAKPAMGAGVPEPSSGALLALGAMALGARGLRKWRQQRHPVNQA